MIEIRWTTQAADDLQAIHDFIERDSPRYALLIAEDILAGIDNRIVYQVTDMILILTIFRVSRRFPSNLK